MAKKYKIAVVGNRDAILPFRMIGFDTFASATETEAKEVLKQLSEQDYGVIYLTEDIAEKIPETVRHYDTVVTPAIILIPTHKGRVGIGSRRIQENVEKAIGSNIL